MSNPLLDLQPNKVSRDIGSYVTYIYGAPKVGKSRFAAEFPNAIFFASEPTQKAIPGIYCIDITTWGEFKKNIKFLKDEAVKEKFKTVVLDTVDLFSVFCERYICNQAGVQDIKDIPYGAGYGRVEREFEQTLRSIINLGYGIVFISHVTTGTFTREDGSEYNKLTPAISSKRCKGVVENLADIYGWIHLREDKETHTTKQVLTLRTDSDSVSGGNHFKYLIPEIDLSYEALAAAIADAIQKDEEMCGNHEYFTDERLAPPVSQTVDFDELMNEFNTIVGQIQNAVGANFGTVWAPRITEIIDRNLGKGKKVHEMDRDQIEQLDLIVSDLKDAVALGL